MPRIPVNFSEKAQTPPAVGGAGYPYRISAKDLMQNFVHATLQVDERPHSSGLELHETKTTGEGGYAGRSISIAGTITSSGSGLPAATTQGDTIFYSGAGDTWTVLPASTYVQSNEEFGIMTAEYGIPEWKKGKFIEFVCYENGVLKTIPVFCNDSPQPI